MKSVLLATLCLSLAGCGYTTGGSGDRIGGYNVGTTYRRDIRSVAVPIFKSVDFSRRDEFDLTRALAQQIESRTPYKLLPREQADTILEGEITSVTRGNLSLDPRSAIPQEQLYIITVNFTWKDLRSGEVLASREGFQQAVSFFPTLGESREAIGKRSAAESLAAAIVNEMSADW